VSARSQAHSAGRAADTEAPGQMTTHSGHRGLQMEEPLIFEMGSTGRTGVDLPPVPQVASKLGGLARQGDIGLPALSEPQVVRHYVRVSQKNYAIDAGLYPLGSCTMKHNPRLNEKVARLPGFSDVHPLQPQSTVQGALEVIDTVAHWLATLTGLPGVAMSPAAGAHAELTGMMAIRAAHEARGEARKRILVPDSAHGTNPATAVLCGYTVDPVPSLPNGRIDLEALKAKLDDDVAAIMLTNPNTCGLFENQIIEVAEAIHAVGAYFYCDGANFNAIVGKVRPGDLGIDVMHLNLHKTFSTPHGGGGPGSGPVVMSAELTPFAPLPYVVKGPEGLRLVETEADQAAAGDGGRAYGRMRSFHGQMGMFVRALAYMMSHGADGLRLVAEDSVLNANYVLARLGRDDSGLSWPVHARGPVRRQLSQRYRGDDARLRQGDDRRGLSPDDGVFPADRAWRNADRTDGIRVQGIDGRVHRHAAGIGGRCQNRRCRALHRCALSGAAPPSRRDPSRAQAAVALDARGAGRSGRVALSLLWCGRRPRRAAGSRS